MSSSRRVREPKPRINLKQRAASLRAKAEAVTRKPRAGAPRPPDPPADLIGACAWAIEHRAWLDHAGLGDADMKAEIERGDAVLRRAAVEPSRGMADLVAKARMLLNDLVAMDDIDEGYVDERLIPVVLRELIALGEAPAVAPLPDPFGGLSCPPGFAPYPFDRPEQWMHIPGVLRAEGERLLRLAVGELDRRLDGMEGRGIGEDEKRSRETAIRRELRIDALMALSGRMDPPAGPLPEPGSEEADAAFSAACRRHTGFLTGICEGYPELRRRDLPVPTWWTTDCLARAMESGAITPVECARLYPLAAEREQRIRAASIAANIGALHALAGANDYPFPPADETDEPDAAEPDPVHAVIALSRQADATLAAFERDTLLKAIPDQPEREDALNEEVEVARKAVLATVPTTRAGRRALVAYVQYRAQAMYGASWRPVVLRNPLGDALLSIMAAIEAEDAAPGVDAGLLALEAEFDAADRACRAALDATDRASDACVWPDMPAELNQTGRDLLVFDMPRTGTRPLPDGRSVLLPYDQREIDLLRASPRTAVYIGGTEGELQPDGVSRRRINKQGQARAEQVIAAWDRWQAETAAAREAVRLPELEAEHGRRSEQRYALLLRVRDTPARSIAGLGVKARVAINMGGMAAADELRTVTADFDPADYEGLLYALAADAAAADHQA